MTPKDSEADYITGPSLSVLRKCWMLSEEGCKITVPKYLPVY